MPIIDLNTATQVFLQWGWLLVTRANAVVFALLIVVFLLGATLRLPEGGRKPRRQAPAPASTSSGKDAS